MVTLSLGGSLVSFILGLILVIGICRESTSSPIPSPDVTVNITGGKDALLVPSSPSLPQPAAAAPVTFPTGSPPPSQSIAITNSNSNDKGRSSFTYSSSVLSGNGQTSSFSVMRSPQTGGKLAYVKVVNGVVQQGVIDDTGIRRQGLDEPEPQISELTSVPGVLPLNVELSSVIRSAVNNYIANLLS